ncbi:MAG: hypothetical protein H2049_00530 [Porphyrobacter sp.]|nr:hypothetical protein [Porphyrobacter sp.]
MPMTEEEIAAWTVQQGNKWPYDAPDSWWQTNGDNPAPPEDWAHSAARGVLRDLTDRRGIKNGFAEIDEEVRAEIVAALARIIRAASPKEAI